MFISRVNGDEWFSFSWQDYRFFCEHNATKSEHEYLESLKEEGYLEGEEDEYKPTRKFVFALIPHLKDEVEVG